MRSTSGDIHNVTISGLSPSTTYYYVVGTVPDLLCGAGPALLQALVAHVWTLKSYSMTLVQVRGAEFHDSAGRRVSDSLRA